MNEGIIQLLRDIIGGMSYTSTVPTLAPGIPWSPASFSPASSSVSSSASASPSSTSVSSPSPSPSPEGGQPTFVAARGRLIRQKREIARLTSFIDTRSTFYNRDRPSLQPDTTCDGIPLDLGLFWRHCCLDINQEEEQEEQQQQDNLQVSQDPYPTIQWGLLNKWKLKNLPEPELHPIQSCPENPDFYDKFFEGLKARPGPGHGFFVRQNCDESCGCIKCKPPFGKARGFYTDKGIIAVPSEPVFGYVYKSGAWILHADYSLNPTSGAPNTSNTSTGAWTSARRRQGGT